MYSIMTAHPPTHMPHHLASMPCAPPSPSAAAARQLTSSTSRSSLASMSHASQASTSLSNISHSSVLASSVFDRPERAPLATATAHPLERRGSSSTNTASAPSSASASKSGSFIGTARLLSRHSSTRERERPASAAGGAVAARSHSVKGKGRDEFDGPRSPQSEADVIETPQLRLDRDPETGRKMINQYLVLEEIGHGTHGRVRLGMDMTVDPDEENDIATGGSPTRPRNYYAIKIVERNPKKKRLAGLQRGTRNEGAKRVAENEIRKEIAIFKKVHHPNVVRMKEIIDDPESSKLFMVLEYCAGGEVKWKGPGAPALTIAETRKIFRDTLLGLEYLHHQGIIHRDIKPSNLLISGDHVKIADFGCSHFSEALVAASWAHDGGEAYVDDVELAKTAGSPAFFAPEMCYSELPDDLPQPAAMTPTAEVPTFTLRPPSTVVEESAAAAAVAAAARKSSSEEMPPPPAPPRPLSNITNPRDSVSRSVSASTVPKGRPRHPITNAIDVWALGVTLYCLLFGTTPFDAANEYLLMQVIPTQAYEVPRTMGREALPTGSNAPEQVKEALDLLSRLLQKDAPRRITLEQAKRHPFTLRDLPDPQGWLATTDPHAQSYVTVTNDEVAAAVTRQSSIRDKVRQRFKSIGNRLGIFSSHRHRSHSVTDSDANDTGGSSGPDAPASQSGTRRVASGNDLPTTPVNGGSLARRLSLLTRDRAQSPRPGPLASALDLGSPLHSEGSGSNGHGGGISLEERLRLPHAAASSADATPRQVPSLTSLDRWRAERGEGSPGPSVGGGYGFRKQSVDLELRPRSGSNASSSAGSILGALGRNIFNRGSSSNGDNSIPIVKRGSMRSSNGHHPGMRSRGYTGSSEDADNVFASSIDSHAMLASSSADGIGADFLRGRSYDNMLRRQSMDTFESGSPSSLGGGGGGGGGHIALQAPSPERANGWDRFGRPDFGASGRRGSTLSEDIRPVIEDEEFDWNGNVPDSDDEDGDDGASSDEGDGLPAGHGFKSAPADWNLSEAVVSSLARKQQQQQQQARWSPTTSPVRARMAMTEAQSILRPSGGIDLNRLSSGGAAGAAGAAGAIGAPAAAGAATAFRVPPSAYRAKSPLAAEPAMRCGARTASGATTPDRFQDADEDDEDDGLVLGLRRGRKGSSLSRHSSVRGRSSPMLGRSPQSPP